MANIRVDTNELDEFIKSLERTNLQLTETAVKAVNKAAPILKEALSKEISESADRGYVTGDLAGSVSAMPAKENEYGVFSVVGPRGTDRKGVSNEDKLLWLENGTMRAGYNLMRRAGPIRYFAVKSVRGKCEKAMEETIEDFIDKNFK